VQNIDDSLLGFSHINIKINDEFNENEDLIIDKKDFINNLQEENTEEEKKYFEDIKNKMKFDVINRHHKKYYFILIFSYLILFNFYLFF
jgi:hypothetical protein